MKNNVKNNKVIGVTGYVGSGKTLFCELVENKYECKIINTDNIAKDIINKNDKFMYLRDRKGDILSNNEIESVKNELHPIVWQYVKDIIDQNDDNVDYFFVETALPTESFFTICDITILVQNNKDIKSNLLINKRNYNNNIINAILKSQEFYENNYNRCDYIIYNNSTKIDFEKNILSILNKILI